MIRIKFFFSLLSFFACCDLWKGSRSIVALPHFLHSVKKVLLFLCLEQIFPYIRCSATTFSSLRIQLFSDSSGWIKIEAADFFQTRILCSWRRNRQTQRTVQGPVQFPLNFINWFSTAALLYSGDGATFMGATIAFSLFFFFTQLWSAAKGEIFFSFFQSNFRHFSAAAGEKVLSCGQKHEPGRATTMEETWNKAVSTLVINWRRFFFFLFHPTTLFIIAVQN